MISHDVRSERHSAVVFDAEEYEARRWLRWAIARAQGWALTDVELIARLDVALAGSEREDTLRELERRLMIWEVPRLVELSSRLSSLEQRHRSPGRAAQSVDRLLQRLLHRIEPARALAATCVVSDRLGRRQGAWRYFRRHGYDPAVESVLSEQLRRESLPDLLLSVAIRSPGVLRQVPLAPLLVRIKGFYWRGRALETLLGDAADAEVLAVAAYWPGEVIFAIRRAGRRDLLPLVRRLLDEHPDNPNVITGAIQAFGIFGQVEEMLRTAALGRGVLSDLEARLAARLGVAHEDVAAAAM